MELLINFFNLVLYKPLFNLLVLIYLYLPGHDFGIAVIILTLLTRIIFYPLGIKAIKSQKELSELQPKIKEIQEKYKNDRETQGKVLMELYQKEKINPFSGCLPLLIQLPILIALYQVFWKGLQPERFSSSLYGFIPHIESINTSFLGIVDLAQAATLKIEGGATQFLWPNIILIIFVGVAQFLQTKMITPKSSKVSLSKKGSPDFSQLMQKQMLYFFPVFMIFILWNLPSALALYWLVTSIFSIFQQYLVFGKRTQTTS